MLQKPEVPLKLVGMKMELKVNYWKKKKELMVLDNFD